MTDNTDLIADAREWARKAAFVGRNVIRDLDRGIANTRRLADALEASDTRLREAEAVVEKVREKHGLSIGPDRIMRHRELTYAVGVALAKFDKPTNQENGEET